MSSIKMCIVCIALSLAPLGAQDAIPAWCRALPRAQNVSLPRVITGGWFEVYRVAPGVFAIYEPHQSEETISYLITGQTQALLFDTGMGIGNIQQVTSELTRLTIVILNSHTHADHVAVTGSSKQFLPRTPTSLAPTLRGRATRHKLKSRLERSVVICPGDSTRRPMRRGRGRSPRTNTTAIASTWAAESWKFSLHPAIPRTQCVYWIGEPVFSLPAILSIPDASG